MLSYHEFQNLKLLGNEPNYWILNQYLLFNKRKLKSSTIVYINYLHQKITTLPISTTDVKQNCEKLATEKMTKKIMFLRAY